MAGLFATCASAQSFDPSQPRSLSDAEKQRILDENEKQASDRTLNAALDGRSTLPIHGEVGVTVGSGGMAGVYGVAAIPLGESGSATIGFEDYRSPKFKLRRH